MKIDPGDLIDSAEVAAVLGLASSNAVSTYRARYDDFPEPVIVKSAGKAVLWYRPDVEAWTRTRGAGATALRPPDEPGKPQRLLTVAEVAEYLGCSRAHVYNLLGKGLPSLEVGRARRFRLAEVDAWLTERRGAS